MSEVEFDLLLDAVKTAIAPIPEDDFLAQTLPLIRRHVPPTTTGPLAAGPVSRGLVRRVLTTERTRFGITNA